MNSTQNADEKREHFRTALFRATKIMAESLCFDPVTGRMFVSTVRDAPALDEFMKDPDRYPNYVLTTDLETGKMEVLSKAEANRKTDRVVLKKMAASGYFQRFQQL